MTEVWQQAVDEHVALLRSWRSTNGGYVSGLMLWAARRSDSDMARFRAADCDVDALERMVPLEELTSQDRRTGAAAVAVEQAELVNRAVTWAVTADMVTLVNHAAKTMPLETVERFDVPCPNGFVYLEEPAFSVVGSPSEEKSGDRKSPHRAFHWYEIPGGLNVVCYKGRQDFVDGEIAPSPEEMRLLPRLRAGLEFDWTFGGPGWSDNSVARWLKALWTISGQRIAAVTPTRLDRPRVRRAQRERLLDDGTVRVISLRRPEHSPRLDHATAVDWSHRWIVSGHWRNQWLGSVQHHRLQWIDEHVKGPDDKPLVVKETVVNVHR